MSNLTTKMTQSSIEINGKLHFSQIWDGQTYLNLTHCLKYEDEYFFQMKIFEKNTFFLFIIYSFNELKVLVILPKVSMVHLTIRMHCNWPADHAIDHISIQLNRLTIQ